MRQALFLGLLVTFVICSKESGEKHTETKEGVQKKPENATSHELEAENFLNVKKLVKV